MNKLLLLLAACLTCTGCPPTPIPVPPPGPAPVVSDACCPAVDTYTPSTVFKDKVFDCTRPTVSAERSVATTQVARCLLAPPEDCLTSLVGEFSAATVACVARDLGASAQVAVRAGTAKPDDLETSMNARDWILSEGIGYR